MYVVCMHPDNGIAPFIDAVPAIPEVKELMALRIQVAMEELIAGGDAEIDTDPLGGMDAAPSKKPRLAN